MLKVESKITNRVKVTVTPQFLPNDIAPAGYEYYFSYTIEIENNSDNWLKLVSRHWVIINSDGHKEEITGEGVVGLKPELEPINGYFRYTSFCPLDTNWGTMEGSYTMVDKDGISHEIEIPRFYLVAETNIL